MTQSLLSMLAKYFSLMRNYVSLVFSQKSSLLRPKHASLCFSNEYSQQYWQESCHGASFVSQSKFDAYAALSTVPLRPRLHYTVFIRRRYGNAPFWPTVYTVQFSYPASNEDCCIRKYLSVYTAVFIRQHFRTVSV